MGKIHQKVAGELFHENRDMTVDHCFSVLAVWAVSLTVQWSHVPGNVVAPAHRLHPVHSPGVDPHQVPRPLDEAVHRNVGTVKVLQHRPPGPC